MIDDAMLLSFLNDVGKALSTGNPAVAAECWAIPAMFLSDDGATLLTERLQIEHMFEQAISAYQASGTAATSPEIIRIDRLTGRLLAIDVRWPYLDAEGQRQGEETSHYVVWADEGGSPRIRVALSRTVATG